MGTSSPHLTLKHVAADAGVSLAAASYALRQSKKISPETRDRVLASAGRLGYRTNPRVASVMSHVRRMYAHQSGERIAFVWVHTSRAQAARDPFLRSVIQGARQRAEQTGYALEEFWTNTPGMTDRRLQQIIHARGIVGVVLSPVTAESAVTLDWDWSIFAPAVVGNVTWTPELHHAGHHHHLGMRLALSKLALAGCKRPVALIEAETDERAKRAWQGAFLTHHPNPTRSSNFLRVATASKLAASATWLRRCKPDALIVSFTRLLDSPALRAACAALKIRPVTLHWNAGRPEIGGIDLHYDLIAGHAVDLVVAQLNNNETGAPTLPRIMLFPGRWVNATGPD